jgi:hypothetical protein
MPSYKILGIFSFANTLQEACIDDPVTLKHEKYNIKSKNAIGVYIKNNKKIGYLPVENNNELLNFKNAYKLTKLQLNQEHPIVEISRCYKTINKLDNYEFEFIKKIKYDYLLFDPPKDLLTPINTLINTFKQKRINVKRIALTYLDTDYINITLETSKGIETFFTVTYQFFNNNIEKYEELYEYNLIEHIFYKDLIFHRPEKYFITNYQSILELEKINCNFLELQICDQLVTLNDKINEIYFTKLYLYCKIINDFDFVIKYLNQFVKRKGDDMEILKRTIENINVLNNFYETYELKIGGFYYNHNNKTYFEIDFINDDSVIIICDITNNNFILACELANKKNLVIFNPLNGTINKM